MNILQDRLAAIQEALTEDGLDGWLFTVFQQNDPVSLGLLGLADEFVSRRAYLLVPREGPPRKLVHRLEPAMLDAMPGTTDSYLRWQELDAALPRLLAGMRRLACQYSPGNALPSISRLDAGTAERLREMGIELVSSAELVQRFAAVWTAEQLATHRRANVLLHESVHAAFQHVSAELRAGRPLDEWSVHRFLLDRFAEQGLTTPAGPIVAVNAHAADPHYVPAAEGSAPIRPGDFLLIDLWGKLETPGAIFGDITWCGVCAPAPEPRHAEIFGCAVAAREAAISLLRERYPQEVVRGFEVDDACRAVVEAAGHGALFGHRTGHSIDTSDHGQGANIDNLETHDTRPLIAMTGFSIEPGIYLPGDFGVRTEINVALLPDAVEVTSVDPQSELLRLL